MPKHVPSFKHLLSRSFAPQPGRNTDTSEKDSVNARLARHRLEHPVHPATLRERPPHLPSNAPGEPGALVPLAAQLDSDALLPGEIVRQTALERRRQARRTAGPSAPSSWTTAPSSSQSTSSRSAMTRRSAVTADDLRRSGELFSHRSPARGRTGPVSLVHFCLVTVLRYVEDETPICASEDPVDVATRGEVLRTQLEWLETHQRAQLLLLNSELAPDGPIPRLRDRTLRLLLRQPADPFSLPDDSRDVDAEESDGESWDTQDDTTSTLHHLPLTLHPSPDKFLGGRHRETFTGLSLTSLNLAYATMPTDMDALVSLLPVSLRQLGLAGAQWRGFGDTAWWRGLKALGTRLIVLTMLDLSYPPFRMTREDAEDVFQPASRRYPSLRLLGMRRTAPTSAETLPAVSFATSPKMLTGSSVQGAGPDDAVVGRERKNISEVIRRDRQRWVDIVWD